MRVFGTILGLLALGIAVVGAVARFLPIDRHSVLIVATGATYLMLAAPVAVLLLGLSRRWVLTLVAAGMTAIMVYLQAPLFLGPPAGDASAVPVRVMTANILYGGGDTKVLAAAATASADVLLVQEMTQEAAVGLSAAGIDRTFPHRVIDPQPYAAGIGLWSRYPIAESGHVNGYSLPMLRARLQVPDVAIDPTVVALHFAAPWPQPIGPWASDMKRYPDTLEQLARNAGSGAVIVAGDFNATLDMRPFRRLLEAGYFDAGEQAGGGLMPTYPNKRGRISAISLDHVLIRNCLATAVRTITVPNADHRAVIADLEVPR
jgi:endonuclease/exonuclease/phosphatase (EEP) superfamily protein YafD